MPPTSGDTPPAAGGDQPQGPSFTPPAPEVAHRRPRWRNALKWISITLASILVLTTAAVVADYFYINGLIKKQPIVLPSGKAVPPKVSPAENFVLIGSDTRQGASGIGTGGSKIGGARSDTTIILHISANNSGATLISIPRDSYVQIPACVVGPHNQLSSPETNKFNAAFSIGAENDNKYAASCTVNTIETLTHIHIDHYAVIDFAGFKRMIDALGGVKMCVATRLYDPIVNEGNGAFHGSGLDLPAGKSVKIDGVQALALMRARYALDGGGDLPRIKRQQEFIAAMIRKATSTSLLTNPLKLQHFLVAAAKSLTTDGFGLGTMHKLATALHDAGSGKVRLLTVPNLTSYPGMPYGDVEWDPAKAPELWKAIRKDLPIPGTKPKPTASPSASLSPTPSLTPTPHGPKLIVAPSGITINVENGTATRGMAHAVATQLAAQGFHIGTITDAATSGYTQTIVEYGPDKVQSSQTVKAALPGSKRQADPTAGEVITVIVGSDFTKVMPVTLSTPTSSSTSTLSPSPSPSISSFSAAKPGCLS